MMALIPQHFLRTRPRGCHSRWCASTRPGISGFPMCNCTSEVPRQNRAPRNDGALAPDHPYQDQARDRRSDTDHPQNVVRRRQRALHGPAHPGRACREQQAFKHKQNTHTDEEVGERYGPHRTETSRLVVFLFYVRAKRGFAPPPCLVPTQIAYGFGAAAVAAGGAAAAGGLPEALLKNLKKSESGRSRKRVSLLFRPFSYAVIER